MLKIPPSVSNIKEGIFIKYEFDVSFVLLDTKNEIKPRFISSVQKICDYENSLFPVFRINCQLDDVFHRLIYDNQNNIICILKLTKKYFNKAALEKVGGSYESASPIASDEVFSESFIPFFKNLKGEFIRDNQKVQNTGSGERLKNPDTGSVSDWAFHDIMVDLNHIGTESINKKIYNVLAKDVKVGDVLMYLLSSNCANVESAIIDPPDNTIQYPYIIIPPRNLKNSLNFLQVQWGIYLDAPIFFADMKRMYVLKQGYLNHELEAGDAPETEIHVYTQIIDNFNSQSNSGHSVNDEKNNFIYKVSQPMKKKDIQTQLSEILPAETIVSNFDLSDCMVDISNKMGQQVYTVKNPMKVINKTEDGHLASNKKIGYEYDATNNLINVSAMTRKLSRKNFLTFAIPNVDIESFNPNKRVRIIIKDNEELNKMFGNKCYCLTSVTFMFVPDKGSFESGSLTGCTAFINLCDGIEKETN